MAIPGYQDLLLPILEFAADGAVHTGSEAVGHVVGAFGLTEDERKVLLPSGRTPLVNNRTHWALTYLRHAGLLASAGHGKFQITERGRKLLADKPAKLDRAILLDLYPELAEFVGAKKPAGQAPPSALPETVLSPEEQLETAYLSLRSQVEHDLLERLKSGGWEFFERAVLDLIVAMGYGGSPAEAAQHVGKSGDGGIDGVINEDKLGLDKVYVQAKRWDGVVGRPVVQGFAGSLDMVYARKGIFITTSSFSGDARKYVAGIEKRIVLIDGDELVRHMVDYQIGVQRKREFIVYRIDDDFFEQAD